MNGRIRVALPQMCSETGLAVARFLENRKDFERLVLAPEDAPGLADAITPEGDLRLLPSMWAEAGGLDGFFIARMRARNA